jgi:type II secretory pathway pseudopilin PulG
LRALTRKPGFTLVTVLLVALFAMALASAAFYVVLNLVDTSNARISDLRLYNAAAYGVEQGKAWIARRISADGVAPRASAPQTPVHTETLAATPFGTTVTVEIYDANFDPASGDYDPDLPPRFPDLMGTASSRDQTFLPSDYATSEGGRFTEGAEGTDGLSSCAYLIRSTARLPFWTDGTTRSKVQEALVVFAAR